MVVARKEVVPCLGNACCVYSEGEMRGEGRKEGGREGERERERRNEGGKERRGREGGERREEGKEWRDINNVMKVERLCKFVY